MRRGPVNVEGKDLGMFFKNEMGQTNEALNDKHKEQLGTNPIHLETKPAALVGLHIFLNSFCELIYTSLLSFQNINCLTCLG